MRSSILIRLVGCSLVSALLFSCAPKKRMVSSEGREVEVSRAAKTAVLDQVAQQQLRYTTFSGRAKSNVIINGKDQYDVTANIRIVRDEAIWISLTALMGIEVARVFITPDSIKIINRLQSEYIRKPFAYLRNFTGSGLRFSSLEQLLVGDVLDQITEDGLAVWQRAEGYLLHKQMDDLQYKVHVGADYQNNYTRIASPASNQQLEAVYSDYQVIAGNSFPNHMEISIATPHLTLQSDMRYSKVVYDGEVELPFTVPSRYKEVQ
ncbi:DUF4292 domain-containing protein [Parapedobacter sp. 10938]|uniref:DUF4292 domain-containing protein n=1 Tax=Parapedobacter flavus TaxID=3110225 RepID=UPI002DB83675|nr:DUF4292 domain-containing protein [Parapedobacter sp. 10938]MEC3879564.1 DUF4292 domain-containing protein [Parapedobacter sp. 10938]